MCLDPERRKEKDLKKARIQPTSSSNNPGYGNMGQPQVEGSVQVKEDVDFAETHCYWKGCDRECHTQEQLVKVVKDFF